MRLEIPDQWAAQCERVVIQLSDRRTWRVFLDEQWRLGFRIYAEGPDFDEVARRVTAQLEQAIAGQIA